MKYSFINKAGRKQTINVPDEYIKVNCRNLGLTKTEAVEMYLSDEGYISNEVVDELTKKAAANKQGRIAGTKQRKPRKRKEDPIKRAFIESMRAFIDDMDGTVNVEATNPERIIAFEYAGERYEVMLTRKRKPKE